MRLYLSLICIFSASIAAVNSLLCVQCSNTTGSYCSEPASPCPPSADSCISSYREDSIGGSDPIPAILRYCGKSSFCGELGSLRYGAIQMQISISCCNTDSCTPPLSPLPPINVTQNGLICPTCSDDSSDPCDSDKTVACLGGEDICINLRSVIKQGDQIFSTYIRGCASDALCNYGNGTLQNIQFTTENDCVRPRKRRSALLSSLGL